MQSLWLYFLCQIFGKQARRIMHGLHVEHRKVSVNGSLSADIARHMQERYTQGKICVVTDKPESLMPAVKKQWYKLIRRVQRQRAGTLDATKILEYTQQIAYMQGMEFVANPPDDFIGVNVGFVTPGQALGYAPDCRTMYVACEAGREELHFITAMMPQGSLVVICEPVLLN